jgi:hypothetical protein
VEHLRGVPVLPRGWVAATPKLDAEAGDDLVSVDTGDEVRVPSGKSSADLRTVLLIAHDVHGAEQNRGVVRHVDRVHQ